MKKDHRDLEGLNPEPDGGAGWPGTDAGRRARSRLDSRLDASLLDPAPATTSRLRLALMIGAPALVVLLAVGLPLWFLRGRDTLDRPVSEASTTTSEPGATTTAPPVSSTEYEFHGTVLDKAGAGPQLCTVVAESLPPQCEGVPVNGLDWADIPWAETAGDTTWAEARLVGTFDGETFTLTRPPGEPEPAEVIDEGDPFATPCPEPAGGWVVTDAALATEEAFEAARIYAQSQPGYAALWIDYLVDPSEGSDLGPATFVLNVTFTGDIEEHEAALRSMYGGPLCVTQGSRLSQAELEALIPEVRAALASSEAHAAGVFGPVSYYNPDGRTGALEVEVFLATEGAQAWADGRWGPGVVELLSVLVPAEGESAFPLHLYVSNQSTEIDPVAVQVTVDGQVVVDQQFEVLGLHNWILFELELAPGEHEVRAVAPDAGAELVETFVVEGEQWAVIDFWFWTGPPEDSQAPSFTWVIQDQPIHFL